MPTKIRFTCWSLRPDLQRRAAPASVKFEKSWPGISNYLARPLPAHSIKAQLYRQSRTGAGLERGWSAPPYPDVGRQSCRVTAVMCDAGSRSNPTGQQLLGWGFLPNAARRQRLQLLFRSALAPRTTPRGSESKRGQVQTADCNNTTCANALAFGVVSHISSQYSTVSPSPAAWRWSDVANRSDVSARVKLV